MKIHKKLFYTGTVILTCLLTACQETPKEDIVKNKAESNLEDEMRYSRVRRRIPKKTAVQKFQNNTRSSGQRAGKLGIWLLMYRQRYIFRRYRKS